MSQIRPLIITFCRCGWLLLLCWVALPRPVLAESSTEFSKEIGAGQLLMGGEAGRAALHIGSHAEMRINGLIAHMTLEQSFRNDSDDWREGIYVLPMHEQAAVTEMEMQIGERVIRAEIKEKLAAKKVYKAARASGKKAALVEQNRPNMFRQSIANIAPGETIVVKLSYIQPVTYDRGTFSLRFPMTITPRYLPGVPHARIAADDLALSPGEAGWAQPTQVVHDAQLITPPMTGNGTGAMINPIRLSISLDPGLPLMEISSEYHDISVKKAASHYEVSLVDEMVPMDRDFVLTWKPTVGDEPQAAVFRESLDGIDYLMLMVLPPDETAENLTLPRDVVFVVDTSGSMQGTSISQAKASLQRALLGLRSGDRFNVIEFNDQSDRLFDAPRAVDPYHLKMARDWVTQLSAGGGTNMSAALESAINEHASESASLQQIVFITDGAVGNERGLFELIHQKIGDIRLFPVGIGSAPNSYFMREAASFGGGTFTHIGSLDEVGAKMNQLFDKIDSPLVTDLAINWTMAVESYPVKLPTLYRGEPLVVVASAPSFDRDIHLSGMTASRAWHRSLSLAAKSSEPGVGTLWARKKIASLEAKSVREGETPALKSELTAVALEHKLVSRFTSLVAVEQIVSRMPHDVAQSTQVPNAVAAGQTAMLPRTATNGSLTFLVGLVALLLWLLLRVNPQRVRSPGQSDQESSEQPLTN